MGGEWRQERNQVYTDEQVTHVVCLGAGVVALEHKTVNASLESYLNARSGEIWPMGAWNWFEDT